MIREAKIHCNDIYEDCIKSVNEDGTLNANYINIRSQSIDYAILEKSNNIAVLPCNIIWDDVGSWNSIFKYNNSNNSEDIQIENDDCLIFRNVNGNKKPVVMFGCKKLAYIETDEVSVIFPLDKSQDIKKLLKLIPEHYH